MMSVVRMTQKLLLEYSPSSVTMSNSDNLEIHLILLSILVVLVFMKLKENHRLSIGSSVLIENVTSTNFTVGTAYNLVSMVSIESLVFRA